MRKKIEFDQYEITNLVEVLCKLGEDMGKTPDEFAIMLGVCAKHMADACGIEVYSERKLHS